MPGQDCVDVSTDHVPQHLQKMDVTVCYSVMYCHKGRQDDAKLSVIIVAVR